MKQFRFPSVMTRHRCICCFVLLSFACALTNYELFSSYLQVAVKRLQRDENLKNSEEDKNLIINYTFGLQQNWQVKQVSKDIYGLSLNSPNSSFSRELLKQTFLDDYESGDVMDNDNNIVDKITSDILATVNDANGNYTNVVDRTCATTDVIGNSCTKGHCLQLQLPSDLRTRIKQLVTPPQLQINHQVRKIMSLMADKVPGFYDFILVSAVSFSHFEEGQAMLYNIHKHLFPYIQNYTFIYYDIGLSTDQRSHMAKICKCHLIDFPFHLFPVYMRFRKCYTWKPIIINAHISRTKLIFWIDASVRFKKQSHKTLELLKKASQQGVLAFKTKLTVAHVTLPSMFHYFGDEACIYNKFQGVLGTCTLFRNELFVKRAILEPWVACAVNSECMCPKGVDLQEIRISCHKETAVYQYGICHRFDQSALSLILVKIYQNKLDVITAPMKDYIEIKRGDGMKYPTEEIASSY